jgi:HEXXH motif-containing protein
VACGLPIDCSLPAAISNPAASLTSPKILDPAATAESVALLDAAVRLLDEVAPDGAEAVRTLTSNIVVRTDAARCDLPYSASHPSTIGRTVIVNPEASPSPGFAAELLLHEATHHALGCAELISPMIIDARPLFEARTPSAWTGNSLTIPAFVHAGVVWAVLAEFWSRYLASNGPDGTAEERHEMAVNGLEVVDYDQALGPYAAHLGDRTIALLDETRRLALA